jgi:hypothetical protein
LPNRGSSGRYAALRGDLSTAGPGPDRAGGGRSAPAQSVSFGYFDLAVQHASDRILRRMGRRQTGDALYALMIEIRRRVPQAVLRTTVIVGFPGETEADFKILTDFVWMGSPMCAARGPRWAGFYR